MTTTANSFLANGPATIGLEARVSFSPHPFKFGALAVGHTAGVFGATNDVTTALPPAVNISAAVWGVSYLNYGVLGESQATGVRGEGNGVRASTDSPTTIPASPALEGHRHPSSLLPDSI